MTSTIPRNPLNPEHKYCIKKRAIKLQRARTLHNLSLVSEGVRKLAQPLLFQQSSLPYDRQKLETRVHGLQTLVSARPESTFWIQSLNIDLRDPGAQTSAGITTILSQIDGLRSLRTHEIYDRLLNAPQQLFTSLTELHVEDPIPYTKFLSILSRCPNLEYLSCAMESLIVVYPGEPPLELASTTLQFLNRLEAPLHFAQLIVPGRPVEHLCISRTYASRSTLSCGVANFAGLQGGSKPLRSFRSLNFAWEDGCLQEISKLFPDLETLVLEVDDTVYHVSSAFFF